MESLIDWIFMFGVACFASFGVGYLIVVTRPVHGRFTDDSLQGMQKFHSLPTPRVGGVAILAGVVVLRMLFDELRPLLDVALAAGVFAFAAGLLEDLTKRVGVTARLGATTASGVLACLWTGVWLTSVDVPYVDSMLAHAWFAVPFTAVALAGVANALNMVDGFNGLAAGTAIIVLLTMATIAGLEGDFELAAFSFGIAMVVAGFLVVNFPGGRLFLGDGGAYFLGFIIGWTAVLLVERNPGLSPWTGIVACAYPIFEMFFSMWRKTWRDGHHPSRPDRVHLHMLVHQRVVRRWLRGSDPVRVNSSTSPLLWILALVPALLVIVYRDDTRALVLSFAAFAMLYLVLYGRLARFRWFSAFRPARSVRHVE